MGAYESSSALRRSRLLEAGACPARRTMGALLWDHEGTGNLSCGQNQPLVGNNSTDGAKRRGVSDS